MFSIFCWSSQKCIESAIWRVLSKGRSGNRNQTIILSRPYDLKSDNVHAGKQCKQLAFPSMYPTLVKTYWVFFTIICSKYTQFFNLGSFVSDENPRIAKPNFTKKTNTSKGKHKYTMPMWDPHPQMSVPVSSEEIWNSEFCSRTKHTGTGGIQLCKP